MQLRIGRGKFGKTKVDFRVYIKEVVFSVREVHLIANHIRTYHNLQMGVPGSDERGFYLTIQRPTTKHKKGKRS